MYIPAHFDENRLEILHEFISRNPLGVLVTHGKGGLDANHIPFELVSDEGRKVGSQGQGADQGQSTGLGFLRAHVARNNPVWQDVSNGDEVLVVFRAGDAYISPTWYPSKHEAHKQVPTWNYRVVHAHGRITVHNDERYVRGVVARLTRTHEASQPTPWKMTDSPADFIDAMLKAIVGIEIEITRLEGKVKLSQNKEVRDIRGAGEALNKQGTSLIGDAMLVCAEVKEAAGK